MRKNGPLFILKCLLLFFTLFFFFSSSSYCLENSSFFSVKIKKYLFSIKLTRRHGMSRINDWAVLATLDLYCRSQYDYRVAIIRIRNRKPKRY